MNSFVLICIVLTIVVLVVLYFILKGKKDRPPEPIVFPEMEEGYYSQLEKNIFAEVNRVRDVESLSPLQFNDVVAVYCESHVNMCMRDGKVSHNDAPARLGEIKAMLSPVRIGEIVAYGYRNAESTIGGFLRSPDHRKVVLGDFNEMGVCAKIDYKGKMYVSIIAVKIK